MACEGGCGPGCCGGSDGASTPIRGGAPQAIVGRVNSRGFREWTTPRDSLVPVLSITQATGRITPQSLAPWRIPAFEGGSATTLGVRGATSIGNDGMALPRQLNESLEGQLVLLTTLRIVTSLQSLQDSDSDGPSPVPSLRPTAFVVGAGGGGGGGVIADLDPRQAIQRMLRAAVKIEEWLDAFWDAFVDCMKSVVDWPTVGAAIIAAWQTFKEAAKNNPIATAAGAAAIMAAAGTFIGFLQELVGWLGLLYTINCIWDACDAAAEKTKNR